MDKILQMRQERAGIVNKARELVNKAEGEKRDFTAEEEKQYEDYMQEIKNLKNKIEKEEELANLEGEMNKSLNNVVNKTQPQAGKKDEKTDYQNAFFKAIAGKSLTSEEKQLIGKFNNAMTEGVDADGGFTVPEDISTRIGELKNTQDALEQYVSVENVQTESGQRTLEVRADSTPFVNVAEAQALGDIGNPKFQRISYQIQKYAGFMQVSNELFADTAENLSNYIAGWLAKKSKATRNSLILAVLNGLSKKAFADYNAIKTAINVDLDPAIAQNSMIFTNQDGYNYLDQLEATDGRPLMQPDPTAPSRKLLFGKPVVVLSNKTLANEDGVGETKYPFIIGDLKEGIVLFDRKKMTVDVTKEGGDAWRNDLTELRAIEREDVKLRDAEAMVFGQITVPVA